MPRVTPPVAVAVTLAVVVMPEPASLTDQPGLVVAEDGEDLYCDRPHSSPLSPGRPQSLLSPEKAQRMAEFMGFLADPNRLRILSLLAQGEICVGDLAVAVGMGESAVSHQLRTLRALRLVSARKQGRHVFYRLLDDHVFGFYQAVVDHLDEPDGPT